MSDFNEYQGYAHSPNNLGGYMHYPIVAKTLFSSCSSFYQTILSYYIHIFIYT